MIFLDLLYLNKSCHFLVKQITAQIDQNEPPNTDRPPEEPPKAVTDNQDEDDYSGGLC